MGLLTRWGSSVDLNYLQEHFKKEKLTREEIIHEAYAELLRSLSHKITMKNDQGQYVHSVPKSIIASITIDNLDVTLSLTCTTDG